MTILVVGLNHRTAPVELREKLALAGDGLQAALAHLRQLPAIYESAILSTCNRLEVYAHVADADDGWQQLEKFLAQLHTISLFELRPSLYYYVGDEAVNHLLHVASGLDSMILGEPQILGQVNTAFADAHQAGNTGPILARLFAQAIHGGKRARTETDISRHTTSVSHAAVRLAQQHFPDLSQSHVLIVGAGEMAALAANALTKYHAQSLTFINRTCERAQVLADEIGGVVMQWQELQEALGMTDIVISSTGAPHTVIDRQVLAEVLPQRNARPLLMIDIAVPRDIDEDVDDLPTVTRYDIDDLNRVLDVNLAQRQASVGAVEHIIGLELSQFMAWYQSRTVTPVIAELRAKITAIAHAEVADTLRRMDDPSERDIAHINRLAHRIVNKIMHTPTIRLKEQAAQGDGELYAELVAQLFALSDVAGNPTLADAWAAMMPESSS